MQQLIDFVGDLYEAAWRPQLWPQVLERLCRELLDARSAAILVEDFQMGAREVLGHFGLPRAAVLSYNLGLGKYDPVFRLQERQPLGVAQQLADHREMVDTHPLYYRWIMKPADLGFVASVSLYRDSEWHVGIGVHRGFTASPFGPAQFEVLEALYPHLRRAVRIHKEMSLLRRRADLISAALSRLVLGVLVVDGDGNVLHANPVAESLLQGHGALRIVDGRIRASQPEQDALLRKSLARVISRSGGKGPTDAMGLGEPDHGQVLTVMMAPLREGLEDALPDMPPDAVMLLLSDPDSSFNLPADHIAGVLGLSEAESLVVTGLVNGLELAQIARQRGVGLETARSQLKSVCRKLGVKRQQDVVRLVLESALARGV